MTGLRDLPPELRIAVARALRDDETHGHKQADIKIAALAALSATDRFFHQVASPMLYQFGALRHPYLLCWATDIGDLSIMAKILEAGPIDPQIGIIRYNARYEYSSWDPRTMSAGERFRRFYRRNGRQFQHSTDFFAQSFDDDGHGRRRSSSPPSADSFFIREHLSETNGLFLNGYDDSDDMDDSSSEQFSEDASVADYFSPGEGSDSAEDSDNDANLDGTGGHGGNGGDDSDDGNSASGDQAGLDDDAMFEEFEEIEREIIGVIRYPDLDDYDDVDEHDIKALYWFPVHIAARSGNLAALELLVESGALLNISSKGFCCKNHQMALYWQDWNETHPAWTPFHVALCHGHTEMVRYMLKECPHIQERLLSYGEPSWSTLPVFISAMRHGYPELAELSLKQGIDDVEDGDPDLSGATLLWRAYWETNTFKDALAILLSYGADIDHDLAQGHTLLVETCLHGNFEEAIALVDAGADVTVVLNNPGQGTALDSAWSRIDQSFPVLIQGCGVLDICCGLSPILNPGAPAPEAPYPQIPPSPWYARDLICRLLNSDARNASKRSPLHIAAAAHNPSAVKILLEFGMDPTSLDEEGVDVLVRASKYHDGSYAPLPEFSDTIFLLVEHLRDSRGKGSSASTVTKSGLNKPRVIDGDTALRNLMEDDVLGTYRHTKLTRNVAALAIIAAGFADINIRDKYGRTILMLVAAEGDEVSVAMLMKYGAKIEHSSEKDDLAAIWVDFVMNDDDRHERNESEVYKLVSTLDVEKRILRNPQFLAFAMYELRQGVVDLMVSSLEPDTLILTGGEAWKKLRDKHYVIMGILDGDESLMGEGETSLTSVYEGCSLVQVAVQVGFPSVVEKLVRDLGVDANQLDPYGRSLFHLVVKSQPMGSDKMIRRLRRLGGDINATDGNGDTPLSLVFKEVLRFYEVGDKLSRHPFYYTALLPSLVRCGSSPSIRNKEGKTVLEMMERVRNHEENGIEMRTFLRANLLYHIMLYRKSIGM